MNNNVTVYIITGDSSSVNDTVKTFLNSNPQSTVISQTPKLEVIPPTSSKKLNFSPNSRTYNVDTFVWSTNSLTPSQKRLAQKYVSTNKKIRFNELSDYIAKNNVRPCNIAISNFLKDSSYKRFINVNSSNKYTVYWEKN